MLHGQEPPTIGASHSYRWGWRQQGASGWQRNRSAVMTATILTALLLALALLFAYRPGSSVQAGEDGTFANDCCGTVELSAGRMLLNGRQTMRYSVARDQRGPYVLPRFYVGVVSYEGLDVDGTRSVARLRLDRLPFPTRITLHEGLKPYVFTRQAQRIRKH